MVHRTLVLALAALMLVPSFAAAQWGGKGSAEPDTIQDVAGGWMFTTADKSAAGERVYFNGIMGQEVGYLPSVGTSVNPNLATVGSSHQTYPFHARALLGVWKDCNKDDFIGFGDNALFEYRTELLRQDHSVCPVLPLTTKEPKDHSGYLVHNDGTWVREFISIGYDQQTGPDQNQFNLNDSASRVWMDDGLPTSAPVGTCYTTAHPVGAYHSVGGLVNLSDCYGTRRFTQAITLVADETGTQDAWATILATRNPWGEEGETTDDSAVVIWDCGKPRIIDQRVTTPAVGPVNVNSTLWVTVSEPSADPQVRTEGSPAATVNATGSGLSSDCVPNYHTDHPNPGQQVAHTPYSLESDEVQNQIDVRVQNDFTLAFYESKRPGPTSVALLGGKQTPNDLGTGQLVYSEGFWQDGTVRGVSYNPLVDRRSIEPQKVTHLTFYAYVSPALVAKHALTLPKGATMGVYGSEACGTSTTGIRNHWQCDKTQWYPGDSMPRDALLGAGPDGKGEPIGTRPFDPYNLRDIDCYDESVRALRQLGIGYGLLSNSACTPP